MDGTCLQKWRRPHSNKRVNRNWTLSWPSEGLQRSPSCDTSKSSRILNLVPSDCDTLTDMGNPRQCTLKVGGSLANDERTSKIVLEGTSWKHYQPHSESMAALQWIFELEGFRRSLVAIHLEPTKRGLRIFNTLTGAGTPGSQCRTVDRDGFQVQVQVSSTYIMMIRVRQAYFQLLWLITLCNCCGWLIYTYKQW